MQERHEHERDREGDARDDVSGHPVSASGTSSRWWIAGSETFRMSREQTVIPSWLVASMSVACSIAHSVVLAARFPLPPAVRSATGGSK